MKKFSFLGGRFLNQAGVQSLLRRSQKAVCGAFEREIVVPAGQAAAVKQRLRNNGFMIVGTSEPNGSSRRIWFIRRGLAGL